MKNIKQLKNKLMLTVVCFCVLLAFWFFSIPCPYRYFFDIECLGCGMSRAYFSLLKFDIKLAFNYHPMFWSVPILYLYFLFDGKLFGKKLIDGIVLAAICLGFIVNWLVKVW